MDIRLEYVSFGGVSDITLKSADEKKTKYGPDKYSVQRTGLREAT